ncbi:hypothetical protein FRB94_006769 [Tulasnella sp. JGI-2019a]|nr:hypothetical protein FRB94_006769 [Tulasnella sp. JGI-2019a]KAG9016232.1 hypothetical protein FRB93_011706 [Tulasnella sp. JGI-2019a]KAG9036453.1 hypothetical protein FRB95_008751 [Tulasnella sp. JGI-2019a]
MFTSLPLISSLVLLAGSLQAAPIRRSANDILVFQFAGVLERLETEFYTQALAKFQDADFTAAGFANVNVPKEIFTGIMSDESTHSSVIEKAIIAQGAQPVTTCKFDFGNALQDVKTMAATARVIENVGVSAYLGGANLLDTKELLVAAATILTVEARHQSLLNVLNAGTAIPSPFDMALSPSQILAIAGAFISGCDLGIPALPALAVTNTGAIAPGTSLTFSSTGIPSDTTGLTCQMMTGGADFALALPFDACVVPQINGPVYIYIVNSTLAQPILSDLTQQFSSSILAGPTLAFIDTIPQTIGEVATSGSATSSSSSGASSSSSSSVDNSVSASTTTITAAQATALVQAAIVQPGANSTDTSSSSTDALANATSSAVQPTSSAVAVAVQVLGWS